MNNKSHFYMKLLDTHDAISALAQLSAAVSEQISAKEQAIVKTFISQFLQSAYIQEFEGRRVSDVLGYFMDLWKTVQAYKPYDLFIDIENPTLEENGWQSSHTVITVMVKNMPFVVDSVRIAVAERNLRIKGIQHTIMFPERDAKGGVTQLLTRDVKNADQIAEGLLCVEVDRITDASEIEALKADLAAVLREVQAAVDDYHPMLQKVEDIRSEWKQNGHPIASKAELQEASEFLKWLAENSFTFLGFVEYEMEGKGAKQQLVRKDESSLGVLREAYAGDDTVLLKDVPKRTREHILKPDVFLFAKSSRRSRVHRPAYADYVVVKRFNDKGEVIGECRFMGLYTARVFNEKLDDVPLLRQKVAMARELSGYDMRDHSGKEYDQLLSVFPRDELFQLSPERLHHAINSALHAQERRKVSLYIREDAFGRFVCALVYVPKEIFNTDLRLKIQNILMEEFNGVDIDFNTLLSESPLARTQFNIKVGKKLTAELKYKEIESKILAVVLSWHDDLEQSLVEHYGEEHGSKYSQLYRKAFNASYREAYVPRRAAADVANIDEVVQGETLSMSFYRALDESDDVFHVKLFHSEVAIMLSDVMPIFENMGFRVIGESPFKFVNEDSAVVWMHDFTLCSSNNSAIDLSKIKDNFESLFVLVWQGDAENDRFNRLLVTSYLGWREISVLRAYARYMRQIRVGNSQELISETLVNHKTLVGVLLDLFDVRFNPKSNRAKHKMAEKFALLEESFKAELENVPNLTEDKILRIFLELIRATVRTNFYQKGTDGQNKTYVCFKLLPRNIPNVPLPVPMFEIFVYSPRIEGVHLRGGKVARGGLRWSDRNEDYRTEVLGLVKAQQVKNAVIVPVGAKGGFVAKQLPQGDREAFMKEGIACYQIFISGLLDVTDNLVNGEVVPPKNTVRHDEDDYYLVVAADKGTATFSDIANKISLDRGHWLGDAFASGGSQGYDHKKMGITARGAWVSVQRHFKELGKDIQKEAFTCVGVGDMAGDVFGNGMLLSECTKLVAAFNHMHIFLDPDPDMKKSFKERKRLFDLPRSSWEDYDKKLISKGGAVLRRDAKSIKLTPEVQALLGVSDESLPPNALISAILKAQVDLLWFGGIGTYIKAKSETHADAGDKANDSLRLNAADLKAKVIGEGANLGMTQLSRIEFGMNGGLSNTDFIDNAAGVDCSDHEVNIKILLNGIVAAGDLTEKQRNSLLYDMTDDVAHHVLLHNYRQTQAISLALYDVGPRMEEYRRLMNSMELSGKLNRELEFLPSEEEIVERKSKGRGLTRAELSVLISYVKSDLKERLNVEEFTRDGHITGEIFRVFPDRLSKKYKTELNNHQLRSEIVATQVANDMVNHMGISFVERLHNSTGANSTSIALAYMIARDVFRLDHWWEQIESLDYKVPAQLQLEMMNKLMSLMRRACRWLIRNRRSELKVMEDKERFTRGVAQISASLSGHLKGSSKQRWQKTYSSMVEQTVPEELASFISGTSMIYASLGIIEAHETSNESLERVAEVYYSIGHRLDLTWFAQQIDALNPASHWQALAREAFREDLDWQQRSLTVGLLSMKGAPKDVYKRIDLWMSNHERLVTRWQQTLTELKASSDAEFAMYSVALRELLDLAQSTAHSLD
jgi:glutamate dehydrogenase